MLLMTIDAPLHLQRLLKGDGVHTHNVSVATGAPDLCCRVCGVTEKTKSGSSWTTLGGIFRSAMSTWQVLHCAIAGNPARSDVVAPLWHAVHAILSGACFLWLK